MCYTKNIELYILSFCLMKVSIKNGLTINKKEDYDERHEIQTVDY